MMLRSLFSLLHISLSVHNLMATIVQQQNFVWLTTKYIMNNLKSTTGTNINKYYYTDYNGHVTILDLNILEEKEC